MTIVEAIEEVMKAEGRPMTSSEIYDAIISSHLYQFKADKPVHVVHTQLRRHCQGLDFSSASPNKRFQLVEGGRFQLMTTPVTVHATPEASLQGVGKTANLAALKKLHRQYVEAFKKRLLGQITKIDPASFERFCRNLLTAYGFEKMVVTRLTKDGGIDGHGRLKVGFTFFNVAFQCKRYTNRNVGRPEIDQFRGAIQGKYEQGIFFTTGGFTSDAARCSFQAGAVPIILLNASTIVDIMIDKQFGVQTTTLPIYEASLDLAILENE